MARTLRIMVSITAMTWLAMMVNSCGGGAGGTTIPSGQYISLTNGKVVIEQGAGVVIVKANQSQLPGVQFDQDVEAELYRGDGFADPRTDVPRAADLIRTFRVSRDGTLLDDLSLGEGVYTAVARNVHAVQDDKEFRCALMAYVFQVFASGGELRTTLPLKFEAKFPALGSVIENSYVAFLTDAGAEKGTSHLFMKHANGTVGPRSRTFVEQKEAGSPVAAVSFEALPGGPTLGNVELLVLKAFKP